MTVRQLPSPKWTVPGTSGGIAAGWKVYTYIPGTSTPKATYTTSEGDVANANPVVLDSRGEATIFWDGIYKVIVKTSADATVWTEDNYGSGLVPVTTTQLSLVPNYSFEEATEDVAVPDNWTITTYTGGTQTLDSSAGNQIHGAKALKFTSAGSGGGFAESEFFPVQEGRAISVRVPMKSSIATVRNVIEILWYDRAQTAVGTQTMYDASSGNPTSWTDQFIVVTPASNYRYAKIRLTGCHSSNATVGSTWFDNVQVSDKTFGGEFSAKATSVSVSAGTEILSLDLGTVYVGQRIQITGRMVLTKGGTPGLTSCTVDQKSGTALIVVGDDVATLPGTDIDDHSINVARTISLSGVIKVTQTGTLVLRLTATSSGSNGDASAQLHALILNQG